MRKKKEEKKERRTLETCYVCGGKITGTPVYVCQEKFRHHRCQPGGARWMESQRAKESDMTQYFGGKNEEDSGKKNS
jgi:hypothetical protein